MQVEILRYSLMLIRLDQSKTEGQPLDVVHMSGEFGSLAISGVWKQCKG